MLVPAIALGVLLLTAAGAVALVGAGQVAAVRAQRVADLAAVSSVRSLVRQADRPPGDPRRASAVVRRALAPVLAADGARIESLAFPDARAGDVGVAVQVTVSVPGPLGIRPRATSRAGVDVRVRAGGATGVASGGGYSGPLTYRDGRPMCPSVAAAYDLMDAAARGAGVDLVVNSGFRSDAEQAVLFARHPDPRWVAPPGKSRHRDATELDLGPPAAYRWLARNAPAFGFVQRYSWEAWHYGYVPGCAPGPAAAAAEPVWGDRAVGDAPPPTPDASVPAWVPAPYRAAVADGARAGGVPPALLAALLQAESGFDPRAVSPAGAQGIAQFMPATAAAVGLRDPFAPAEAIAAAGRLLGAHVRRFGSVPLALAAYNAGPGAVQRYGGIPPFAETRAYVARIVALAAGGGSPAGGAWSSAVVLLPVPA